MCSKAPSPAAKRRDLSPPKRGEVKSLPSSWGLAKLQRHHLALLLRAHEMLRQRWDAAGPPRALNWPRARARRALERSTRDGNA